MAQSYNRQGITIKRVNFFLKIEHKPRSNGPNDAFERNPGRVRFVSRAILSTPKLHFGRSMNRSGDQPVDTPRMHVLVAGSKVDAHIARYAPASIQSDLAAARTKFGNALCGCQKSPLPLVIKELKGKLFLACWPDQSSRHTLNCPFYSDQAGASHEYQSGAIESDGSKTLLQLHHPLVQARSPQPTDSSTRKSQPANGLSKLHLWGVLHHLWEGAGINRWYPGWKRDWGFVRSVVRRVAQSTDAGGMALLPSLYMPPIWSVKRKDDIADLWREFTRPLYEHHRNSDPVYSGVVIGVVRLLEPSQYGFAIKLQHHSQAFFLDKATADRLASYSRKGWAALKMMGSVDPDGETPTVVAALRIQASASKTLVVIEGALMRTSRNYVPVSSSFEETVANLLIDQGRALVRPLHYDAHSSDLAHFVLTDCANPLSPDTGPMKVCLFIYGPAIDPAHQARLESRDRELADRMGCAFWSWNVRQQKTPPPFPLAISPTASPR